MKVIVVGCGRMGSELAYLLYKRGQEVSVIDNSPAAFNNLPPDFQGHLIEGDAMALDVLRRAGIENTNALAVVTSSDNLNLVIGHVANSVYNVPKVIARNFEPRLREIFETFNLQVVSATNWGAQRMEEMIYHENIRAVYSAGNGEVEIYELTLPVGWDRKLVADLSLSEGCCILASITRAGRSFIPRQDDELLVGDRLHLSSTFEGIEDLRKRLGLMKG
jgi:trk system potassium uptake protein TrkA